MIVRTRIPVHNFCAKIPADCVTILEVEIGDDLLGYLRFNKSQIGLHYSVGTDIIKLNGSYPDSFLKKLWFKVKEKYFRPYITITYTNRRLSQYKHK